MPRHACLATLLAIALGAMPALAGRPPALSGARLEAAKQDWRRVSAGKLTASEFKTRYGLTNGSMTRLRKTYPQDFGKLDLSLRERKFSAGELRTLAGDWKRIAAGEITLTEFKATHSLNSDTFDRLIGEHRSLFPKIELKLGGSRLAEQRRAERQDPARVSRLSSAWDTEVLGGKLSIEEFYRKHQTSKKEITELRKLPEQAGRFASATGIASARAKKTLSAERISELSRLWKSSVVTGQQSMQDFRKAQKVPQRVYRELREDKKAFPDPAQLVHDGGPERRTFTEAQLTSMRADWQKVLSLDMDREAFLKKHNLHSEMMKRLRDEHPGDFPSLKGKTRTTQFSDRQLEAMRADWLLVVAGRLSEPDFREKHGVSSQVFQRVRKQGDLTRDFPVLKGPNTPKTATVDRAVVSDFAALRAGSLGASEFRRRHPDVRAAELVGLQVLARSAGKRSLAEELGLVKPEPPKPPRPVKLPPEPKTAPKPRNESKYASRSLYSESQLAEAKALFARHQRGELELGTGVAPELRKLGITATGQGIAYLRSLDPIAFEGREEFLKRNHTAIVEDLVTLATTNQHVVRKWSDLAEVVARDTAFQARWGKVKIDPMLGVVKRDRDGEGYLRDAMGAIGTQVGKLSGGPRRERIEREIPTEPVTPRQKSARALAEALQGLPRSQKSLERVVAQLAKTDTNFATRRKWMSLRSEFEGVFPELARWDFNMHRPYSLKYVARWTEAAHQAGPGASYEAICKIFMKSQEYREDRRTPPKASGTVIMAGQNPKLISSWANRRTYQRTRQLLELLRTAPDGASIYSLGKQIKAAGFPLSYAQVWIKKLSAEDAEYYGMSKENFDLLKRSGFRGLGQPKDPSFDPNREPPEINMELVKDILDTPRMPKLLEHAISRLDGRRPFESHNVMFINHRYSDIVSLVDAMARAGMQRENAVFVSTPYPFKDAVTYQLRKSGVRTIVPRQDMASYAKAVELGIRRMLKTHEEQAQRWGKGKPILILDDGGMASKIIAAKFKEHASKFRIVEVTAAGVRLAQEFQKEHKRLPFVYYSIAHTELKQKITSSFFGRRVARRLVDLIPQSGVKPLNKKVAIIGGGPMGLFAGAEMRKQGYDVTFVDTNPAVAKRLHDKYGFKVAPIEKALPGSGIILGMSGYQTIKKEHLPLIEDGAIVAQGSSKRNEFEMTAFEKMASSKTLLPREDGLKQKSFTYAFGRKKVHFFGDGWTLNHDGSLHGTPMRDIQLELAIYFESAVHAASTPLGQTGVFREIGQDLQLHYFKQWRKMRLE